MKVRQLLLAATLASVFAGANATSVNGVEINDNRVKAMLQMMEQQTGQAIPESARQAVIDQLVTAEILSQEAQKQGLDKDAEFIATLENIKTMTLAGQFVKDYQKRNPVTDAQLRADYDKIKAETPPQKQYNASHILVQTEAQAKAVLAALKKGKPFATLAKEKSLDPGSKDNGGQLGWSDPANFVPEFSEAMMALSKGQITNTAVKTQFGYHIIKLNDVKDESLPPFEQVREQLIQKVQGDMLEKLIQDLKAKATIK